MSRLTCKYDGMNIVTETIVRGHCMNCDEYCNTIDVLGGDCDNCAIQMAFDKLAEYEDLEEQGLLLKLPCKIGDEIYWICDEDEDGNKGLCVKGESYVEAIGVDKDGFLISTDDGSWDRPNKSRWCFLTKEEAEQELKRLESAE